MQVTVRTFAILRELSADRVVLTLPDAARLGDAWEAMAERFPALRPHREYVRGARAGAYADWDIPLDEGDEVAFLPPVSGGATRDHDTDQRADRRGRAGAGAGGLRARCGRDLRRPRP
jgi:molybdopterin converting factor small subunit